MAVFRLSKMVRMQREALEMTQDQLVEIYGGTETEANEICSVDTLRRIENGKVTRVKNEIFAQIMQKFGVLPERVYASLAVTDTKALRLKAEIHVHICQKEYKQAEKKLAKLEPMLVPDYPRNQQYLMERRATLAYEQRALDAEEYLKILKDALRPTVPMLDQIDIAGWPFNQNEFDILSEMGNVYHSLKNREKEYEFLMKLKENTETRYMDSLHYVVWHMRALSGLSQLMCMENRYEESLEYCRGGIKECKAWRILGNVYRFLYDIAWSKEQQIKKGIFKVVRHSEKQGLSIEQERVFSKKQLVQAYYLSVAQGNWYQSERIKRLYESFYPKEAKLL